MIALLAGAFVFTLVFCETEKAGDTFWAIVIGYSIASVAGF